MLAIPDTIKKKLEQTMNEHTGTKKNKYMESDASFDDLYPRYIRNMATVHWTPLHITKLSVDFLANNGGKILDIGSGVGKFCLAGAYYAPDTEFYGIEQRKYLIDHALEAQQKLGIDNNVSFINANFTQLDLREFDHFYFYNSFQENIEGYDKIDESIEYSNALYEYYVVYLFNRLQQMPKGTRIVTYHFFYEMPKEFDLVESRANGDLNFWIKR